MFNLGSSYFHFPLTTVRHLLNVHSSTLHDFCKHCFCNPVLERVKYLIQIGRGYCILRYLMSVVTNVGRSVGRRQQLGQGPLHGGRRAGGLGTRRGAQGGRVLRLPAGLPADALARWRHWVRYGHSVDQQDPRGISRPHYAHLLHRAVAQGQ